LVEVAPTSQSIVAKEGSIVSNITQTINNYHLRPLVIVIGCCALIGLALAIWVRLQRDHSPTFAGTIRWLAGGPVQHALVQLIGTSCGSAAAGDDSLGSNEGVTNDVGFFEFSKCDPFGRAQLLQPRVNIEVPESSWYCREVPLVADHRIDIVLDRAQSNGKCWQSNVTSPVPRSNPDAGHKPRQDRDARPSKSRDASRPEEADLDQFDSDEPDEVDTISVPRGHPLPSNGIALSMSEEGVRTICSLTTVAGISAQDTLRTIRQARGEPTREKSDEEFRFYIYEDVGATIAVASLAVDPNERITSLSFSTTSASLPKSDLNVEAIGTSQRAVLTALGAQGDVYLCYARFYAAQCRIAVEFSWGDPAGDDCLDQSAPYRAVGIHWDTDE
jgi:hypothetical protein